MRRRIGRRAHRAEKFARAEGDGGAAAVGGDVLRVFDPDDFIHRFDDVGIERDIGVVAEKADGGGISRIDVRLQIARQADDGIGAVFVKEILGICGRVGDGDDFHVGRGVDFVRELAAVAGVVEVNHGDGRVFGEIVSEKDGEEDGDDERDHDGHFFVGHAHAGEEDFEFIFEGVHRCVPRWSCRG